MYAVNSDISNFDLKIDTVIMNPPFGVQKRKADKIFLETAMSVSDTIYSIHKIESKKFIEKLAMEHNFKVLNIINKVFSIKRSYGFHSKEVHNIAVGFWHLGR